VIRKGLFKISAQIFQITLPESNALEFHNRSSVNLPPRLKNSAWRLVYTMPLKTAQPLTKKGYNSKKYVFDVGIANFLLTHLMPIQFGEGDQAAVMLLENGVLYACCEVAGHKPPEHDFLCIVK
jgi:hypothetical protein